LAIQSHTSRFHHDCFRTLHYVFFSSKSNLEFLKKLETLNFDDTGVTPIKLFGRTINNTIIFEDMITIIKSSRKGEIIGVFLENENIKSIKTWEAALAENNIGRIDMSAAVAHIMHPKEDVELLKIKKACTIIGQMFNHHV
ncbi:hypothetical protein PV328_012376, partial [Microctonus aethiopoides]